MIDYSAVHAGRGELVGLRNATLISPFLTQKNLNFSCFDPERPNLTIYNVLKLD